MMHIGHVAIRVTDLEGAAAYAQRTLGLRVRSREDDTVLLTSNEKHHELQLLRGSEAGLDHVGLELETSAELEAVYDRALGAGATAAGPSDVDGVCEARRFAGPAGITYEVYTGMSRDVREPLAYLPAAVRKLGHLTFACADHEAVLDFWLTGLGFRVSDQAAGLTWTRCDADHHGLAVGPAPAGNALHHHAWEVQDWSALAQRCDDLALAGVSLGWGPVRHGPGFNLAAYFPDHEAGIVEIYSDMLRIHDEASYQPVDWSTEPRALNLWGPGPDADLLAAGMPILRATA